jgi:hypothetical protein
VPIATRAFTRASASKSFGTPRCNTLGTVQLYWRRQSSGVRCTNAAPNATTALSTSREFTLLIRRQSTQEALNSKPMHPRVLPARLWLIPLPPQGRYQPKLSILIAKTLRKHVRSSRIVPKQARHSVDGYCKRSFRTKPLLSPRTSTTRSRN